MNDLEKYYEMSLYPLQNGVLNTVRQVETPFFLTGGTALSRYYTHHRYSDDLDFFVADDPGYGAYVNAILQRFVEAEKEGVFQLDRNSVNKGRAYTQLFIVDVMLPDNILKVEFINDVAPHYGSITVDSVLGRVDSWENILTNKITALFRSEPKDVVDIHAIALKKKFNWRDIIAKAKSKEVGVSPEVVYDILKSFPLECLKSIKWITPPQTKEFENNMEIICNDILYGKDNSLSR